jgi:hypothetical protein
MVVQPWAPTRRAPTFKGLLRRACQLHPRPWFIGYNDMLPWPHPTYQGD